MDLTGHNGILCEDASSYHHDGEDEDDGEDDEDEGEDEDEEEDAFSDGALAMDALP